MSGYKMNEVYFEECNPKTVYLRGVIEPRVHIVDDSSFRISASNTNLLRMIQKELNLEHSLISYPNRKAQAFEVSGAPLFVNYLREMGMGRKEDIRLPHDIVEQLMPDYIRGVLDSKTYMQLTGTHIHMQYNQLFLKELNEKIIELTGMRPPSSVKDGRVFYNKTKSLAVKELIYDRAQSASLFVPEKRGMFEWYEANQAPQEIAKKKNREMIYDAKKFLEKGMRVGDVANRYGITSQTFIRKFKRMEGITPKNWQKNIIT